MMDLNRRYAGRNGFLVYQSDFHKLSLIFCIHLTSALVITLWRRNLLPPPPPMKKLPFMLSTMWFSYLAHAFYFFFGLFLKDFDIEVRIHHCIAVGFALWVVFFERTWYQSAMFTFPWWLHATAYTVNGIAMFFPSVKEVVQIITVLKAYNLSLFLMCFSGLVWGCWEKWSRFTPVVPVVGLWMLVCNYHTYCINMKAQMMCFANRTRDPGYWKHKTFMFGFCAFVAVLGFGTFAREMMRKRRQGYAPIKTVDMVPLARGKVEEKV